MFQNVNVNTKEQTEYCNYTYMVAFINITYCVPKSHIVLNMLKCSNTHRHNGECHVDSSHSNCQIFCFFTFGHGKYFRCVIYDLKMK